MRNRFLLLVALTTIFSSCYMNKSFLSPTKTIGRTKLTLRDTLVTFIDSISYQPVFTKSGKATISYPFTVESVIFKSSNGHKLNGWILKPKNFKPTVTIINFHGNGGMLLSQFEGMTPLVEQGFQVFMFDYSGFGYSEGTAERKFVLEDGLSAIDYVKDNPTFANTKLVVYGQSFGGHLATVAGTLRQDKIDALVTEGAFSSHDDIAGQGIWTIMARLTVKEMYAAKKYVKDFKKPILIIHSTEDKTIPFKMAKKLYKNANEPKELYTIKGKHIMGTILYRKEIAEKIMKMIQ
jgi:dipeptidyl aminopeptidase/acylaminoacyl peptidase